MMPGKIPSRSRLSRAYIAAHLEQEKKSNSLSVRSFTRTPYRAQQEGP
jgi:hypothetical protein